MEFQVKLISSITKSGPESSKSATIFVQMKKKIISELIQIEYLWYVSVLASEIQAQKQRENQQCRCLKSKCSHGDVK